MRSSMWCRNCGNIIVFVNTDSKFSVRIQKYNNYLIFEHCSINVRTIFHEEERKLKFRKLNILYNMWVVASSCSRLILRWKETETYWGMQISVNNEILVLLGEQVNKTKPPEMLADVFFIFYFCIINTLKVWSQKTVTTSSCCGHAWSSSNLWTKILLTSYRDAYYYIFLSLRYT